MGRIEAEPASRATPAPSKITPRYQVGQQVRLGTGETVTIKKVNPDGTFEY